MRRLRNATLLVLVAALVAGTANVALANTELVPASRVVFPYIDISSGRETFLLLTNTGTQTVNLHLEFYSQKCDRQNESTILTEKDLAVIAVSQLSSVAAPTFLLGVAGNEGVTKQQNVFGIGWLDVDVRNDCGGNLRGCDGIQYNGIMGTAVIIDVNRDFAFAYPAAAAQGSSSFGRNGTIVTRDDAGLTTGWDGAYETYPSGIFIPAYFAETACVKDADLTAFLAIAGPADAWRKEGPGDDLGETGAGGTGVSQLVRTQANLYDGDENSVSDQANAHYINGQLCNIYDAAALRGAYDTSLPVTANYATADFSEGQINTVGWIEIFSQQRSRFGASSPAGLPPNGSFSSLNGFDDSQRNRGLVAVLFQIEDETLILGTPPVTGTIHVADAIRGWADPATQIDWPCFGTEGLGGISPPTVVAGVFGFAPTCQELPPFTQDVNPSWIGDNAETPGGETRRGN